MLLLYLQIPIKLRSWWLLKLPGEAEWGEDKHHEEQKEIELPHHAELLTGPETQRALDQNIFLS